MHESEKKVKSLSHVRLFTTPWTAVYQAPLSMEFSRQEYWSGVPLLSPKREIIGGELIVREVLNSPVTLSAQCSGLPSGSVDRTPVLKWFYIRNSRNRAQ